MNLIVRPAPRADFSWLQLRTGCALTSDFTAIEAITYRHAGPEDEYRICGMVGYCNTTPAAIQAHMAVDAPTVWRSLLLPALHYPFQELRKRLILAVIPQSNRRSLRFVRHVGFQETYRIRDGWEQGEDLLFLELRREDCRFLKTDGQRAVGVEPADSASGGVLGPSPRQPPQATYHERAA